MSRAYPSYAIPAQTKAVFSDLLNEEAIANAGVQNAVTVANAAAGVFGVVAVATDATFSLTFASDADATNTLGVVALYTGDTGAFKLKSLNSMTLGTPVLLEAAPVPYVILPSAFGIAWEFVITAQAANAGVAKAGTWTFYDRYHIVGAAVVGDRAIATLTLSKTYTP